MINGSNLAFFLYCCIFFQTTFPSSHSFPSLPLSSSSFLFFFPRSQNLSCYFFYAGLKLNILLPQFPKDYKSAYNEETILDFSNYLLLHAIMLMVGYISKVLILWSNLVFFCVYDETQSLTYEADAVAPNGAQARKCLQKFPGGIH